MADEELRVRQLAYRIWESEGRPEGQEQRHWEMARKIVTAERESGRDVHPGDAYPDIEVESDAQDPDLPVREDELGVDQDELGSGASGAASPATDPEQQALTDEALDRNLGRDRDDVPVTQSDAPSAATPLPEESATVKRARKPRRTEDSVTTPNATDTSTPGRSATTRSQATRSRTAAAKEKAKTTGATTTTKAKASSKGSVEKSTQTRSTTAGKNAKTAKNTKASDTPRKPKK